MKSKSFNLNHKTLEKGRQNKTFDFTGYYRTSEETNKALEITNNAEGINKENKFISKSKIYTPISQNLSKKKGKVELLNISRIDIDGPSFDISVAKSTALNESKVTSTPQASLKSKKKDKVKSIMKSSSIQSENYMDESHVYATPGKSKKRNKSVSFMLDETEEVVVKKTKSNTTITPNAEYSKNTDSSINKVKKNKNKKEKHEDNTVNITLDAPEGSKTKDNNNVQSEVELSNINVGQSDDEKQERLNKKRKFKKLKKQISDDNLDPNSEISSKVEPTREMKKKRDLKVKKLKSRETETDEEPSSKSRRREIKPEVIVENLENLSIGNNTHTITNLLDEMVVAEKDKRKKQKHKLNKDKKPVLIAPSPENADEPNVEKEKVKVKWQKRKWNKDRKGERAVDADSTVIVDNLPISIMCTYKKLLSEHFVKYGIIKKIGVAEVYTTEQSRPVFSTTVNFYSDGAAAQALGEDNSVFEGSRIHVRKALPPTQTTLVVRSYADLTEQVLSSVFLPAGRIRSIQLLIKGKKSNGTAFIDFDSPETLEKAIQLAQDAKIGTKKVHVFRFELRGKKAKKTEKTASYNTANENESEDSNE